MYELTHEQVQNIVEKMMKDIPYNINIMNSSGIIIGSGNKERIGTLHHGAVAAIKQKKAVEIKKDEQFVKKGINLPIELNSSIIGVVGISGEVKETRPFGNLLKSAVILLIEQNLALEEKNLKKNLRQQFFNLIRNPDTAYTEELTDQAMDYGINLHKPSQIVYAEFPDEIQENTFFHFPCFQTSSQSLWIVIQEEKRIETLLESIKNQFPDALISLSKMNDLISEGFLQAKAAMRILKGLFFNEKVISYARYEFIADISERQRNDTKGSPKALLLHENEDLIKTLQVYLSCNLNVNETAKRLIIHRNTLSYRLNRIYKITGKNPQNVFDLVELIFMLVNRI